MEYIVGIVLVLTISILATIVRLDRDRAFYPTLMIVIASYYGLFAVMGGSFQVLTIESIIILVFLLFSIIGFKRNLWIVVAALFAHGIFDFFHSYLISNPGVPQWWSMFCLSYDIVAAAYLAWLLNGSKIIAKSR
jgi:hypothetical protein